MATIDANAFANQAFATIQQVTIYSGLPADPEDEEGLQKLVVIVGALQAAVTNARMIRFTPTPAGTPEAVPAGSIAAPAATLAPPPIPVPPPERPVRR
jgi:hypothetical protein